ncbi:hypothetical protein LPJ72_004486 [Coemansia sp. Benny D160-2]|nr:hypothetical protein LPJ72_004486 [Coemansia sp. Benny D160-2]
MVVAEAATAAAEAGGSLSPKRTASQAIELPDLSPTENHSPPPFDQYLNAKNRVRIASDTKCSTYFIGGVQIHFPFAPYPSQLGMMNHMIRALNGSHNTMIESPTGSGKSLALLCAALGWRRHFAAKVTQSKASVVRIIRKFAEHNPLPDFCGPDMSPDAISKPLAEKESFQGKPGPGNSVKTDQPEPDVKPQLELNSDDNDDFVESSRRYIPYSKPTIGTAKSDTFCHPAGDDKSDLKGSLQNISQARDHNRRLGVALSDMSQTTKHILDIAKMRIPPGLDANDVSILEDYRDNYGQSTGIPRIYFGSRTHKQVSQLVDELRKKTPYRVPMAVLGSRKQMCIHGKARKAASVDEMCSELRDSNTCGPFARFRKLMGAGSLSQGGEHEIWDIEDLVKLGRQRAACPYYASRDMAGAADLIFCPYNYILDPSVREAAGISLANNVIILDEAHNIEGAARDAASKEITDIQLGILISECDKMASMSVLPDKHMRISRMAASVCYWLQNEDNTYEFRDYESQTCVWPKPDSSLVSVLAQLGFTPHLVRQLESDFNAIEAYIKELPKAKDPTNRLGGIIQPETDHVSEKHSLHLSGPSMRLVGELLRVLKCILLDGGLYESDYKVAIIRAPNPMRNRKGFRNSRQSRGGDTSEAPYFVNTLAFWAMSPAIVFAEISKLSRTIVLTSGTLSPLDSYASELRTVFKSTLEANHVVEPCRFKAMCIKTGPSGGLLEGKYKNADMLTFQDDLGQAIASIAAHCPDGMLVFVTSYSLLNKLLARWTVTGDLARIEEYKEVFTEGQGSSKEEFDELLNSYRTLMRKEPDSKTPLERGAIMFAVYRGKVSEGIDFSDHMCRTIINIGIPYPAFKDVKVILKREYNDLHCTPSQQESVSGQTLSGSQWYDIQAFRAINQALGRCLRHKMDWGAIIMLESRFSYSCNVSQLSKWIRNHVRVYDGFSDAQDELESFYDTRIQEDKASSNNVVHSLVDDE